MSKYKCSKNFAVEKYDEFENVMENEFVDVEEGSVWDKKDYTSMNEVRLEKECGTWLEVDIQTFIEHFEPID